MKRFLALALGLVAVGAPAQTVRDPAPRLPAIAMDISSWGRPVSSWTLDAQGKGSYTRTEPSAHNPKAIVTRGFTAGTSGFRKLRMLLRRAEMLRGPNPRCDRRIYDLEYGAITWTGLDRRKRQLNFDMGCPYSSAPKVIDDLAKAEALVAGWAANGPILETRKVEP